MDALSLDRLLVRLSLDGKDVVETCGVCGFPLLSVGGATVVARPKTVLSKEDGRYVPRPGAEYVVVGEGGVPAAEIAGRPCRRGVTHVSTEEFARRFGDLFAVSELRAEEPEDPFARYLMA